MPPVANAGAFTPRRSARLSTKATSVAEESAVTTGSQQRRKGPLTKIKTRKSNAYGASGRVGAIEALSVSDTGFAEAFQDQRGDAFTRDQAEEDEEEDEADELGALTPVMSGALSGALHGHSSTPIRQGYSRLRRSLSFLATDEITSSDDHFATSLGNTSKSFGMNHEGGMMFPSQRPVLQTQKPSPNPAQTQTGVMPQHSSVSVQSGSNPPAASQWFSRVGLQKEGGDAGRPWKKYAAWGFWALLMIAAVGLISSIASSPASGTTVRPSMTRAVTARISRVWYGLADTVMPRGYLGGNGTHSSDALWALDKKLNDKFKGQFDIMDRSLQELKEELPQVLVIRRYPDGRREISDEFWTALLNKVTSHGDDAEWTNFLEKNRKKLNDIFDAQGSADGSNALSETVSRQEFVELMQSQYSTLSARVDELILKAVRGQSKKFKAAMISQLHLMALAQTNLVANYEVNIGKANYFSPGIGALIIPSLTSATFLDNSGVFARFALTLGLIPPRNPPKAALTRWEEPGECWCSAPDSRRKGQAQLAVSLGQSMFPNQITIEHVPMKMVPAANINSAPRDVELWVEADELVTSQYSYSDSQCQPGPAGWKCIGVVKYNIHANNHVQTFDLDTTTTAPITKAMVRVVSNWGADHTCLYRVRLHGNTVDEHEYTTFLNSPAA